MPVCTWLDSDEYTQPTSNKDLNDLLKEVRERTGDDWRISERVVHERRFLRKPRMHRRYELYVQTVGSEFQIINLARDHEWSINTVNTAELVANYLLGFLGGMDQSRFSAQPPILPVDPEKAYQVGITVQPSTAPLRLKVAPMEEYAGQHNPTLALYTDDGRRLPGQLDLTISSPVGERTTVTCSFAVGDDVRIERAP